MSYWRNAKRMEAVMRINLERVLSRLEELYQCGLLEDGNHTRMAFSPEDLKGREVFQNYFRKLGLDPRIDEAGNNIVRLEGRNPDLPVIMTGSHLDTVPDGGRYDGALGCIGGLEVCETLVENHYQLNHPLEVIVFTDEEGFRFGNGLLGSSAIAGGKLGISENDTDLYGEKRSEVMKKCGISVMDAYKAKRDKDSVHCFMELHIEQGASLYRNQTSIGIVSSIAGVLRYEVTIEGEANHAGSTVMDERKDALAAAAKFIAKLPNIIKSCGNHYTVGTVGTIKVTPNSVNVVPGSCTFQLEVRDQDEKVIKNICNQAKEHIEQICREMGETCTFTKISYHEPAPMAGWVKDAIECAVRKLGIQYEIVPSGAFHDSLIMTAAFPTGMIFVPSVDGISHSRYEKTLDKDIEQGCNALLQTILEVDDVAE